MKDFDQKTYVAVYDQFEVIMIFSVAWRSRSDVVHLLTYSTLAVT